MTLWTANSVKEWLASVQPQFGISTIELLVADLLMDYGEERIVDVGGLPFVRYDYALIPFASDLYGMYRGVYLPVILSNGGREVPGLFYPVPLPAPSFNDYMTLVKSKRSHMLGSKAAKVKWAVATDIQECVRISRYLHETYAAHVVDLCTKHNVPNEIAVRTSTWWSNPEMQLGSIAMAYAEADVGVVAGMQLLLESDCVNCGAIAFNKAPEYKPYSLAVCAHLAALRWAFDNNYKLVNFGKNPPGVGDYKSEFAALEPVYGLTA